MAMGQLAGELAGHWKRPSPATSAFVQERPSHLHNSHAHLGLAKRRHEHFLEHTQTNTTPHPSHHNQFFKSPQPRVGDMYPVGASFVAKHYSDEFAKKAYDGYSQVGTISDRGGSDVGSCTFTDIMAEHNHWAKARSPKANRPHLDRPKEFTMNWEGEMPRQRPQSARRYAPSSSAHNGSDKSLGTRGRFRPPPRSEQSLASSDTGHGHDYRQAKPKDPKAHEPHPTETKERFFTSHSRMQKAKQLCKTALKVDHDRWERIECGSHGHSAGGSVHGSICNKSRTKPTPAGARPRTAR